MASSSELPIVDIHTHIYPPSYLSLLRSRTSVPYLLDLPDQSLPPRLIILPSDDDPSLPPESRGRPIDASYSSISEKLHFMQTHGIQTSVISLANPWLDFLSPADEPTKWATTINNELQHLCAQHSGKFYAFATLPLSAPPPTIVSEILRLQSLPYIKGIILGTSGLGPGLDDQNLTSIWAALQETQTLIFLHPHYGLPASVYGPRAAEYGHVLPLALGFPIETTIAFTRLFLSGVFDLFPRLMILIAHAGGTVPYLAGRIDSCVQHERQFPSSEETGRRGPRRGLGTVLRENVWLDAVVYSETSVKAAVEVVGGKERVLFGTDHPFFPPLGEGAERWASVETNLDAVRGCEGGAGMILGGNAVELLGLKPASDRMT
ncbi:MAG: hypothetical protein L6R40_006146 [Gallowayella cf. fulva]|nr:MAG: hypothetical protein L6R40_006146 [Xanthomendoza cf. fulva]